MAAISTLIDDFNDNSVDAAKWTTTLTASETNQRAQVPNHPSYASFISVNTYDLTGSSIFCICVPPTTNANVSETFLALDVNGSNSLRWFFSSGGQFSARYVLAGSSSDSFIGTYDPTNHKWLRIRESGGTISWDTSPDGSTWTNKRTVSTGTFTPAITALSVSLICGRFDANPSTDFAVFDNVNTLGVTSISLGETGSAADSFTWTGTATKSLADTGSGSEALTLPSKGISLAESPSASDALSVSMGSTSISLSESGSASESFTWTGTASKALAESGSASMAFSVIKGTTLTPDSLGTMVELQVGSSVLWSSDIGSQIASASPSGYTSCPDRSSLQTTGDIEARVDVAAQDWTPPVQEVLASKNTGWAITSNNLAWLFILRTDGKLQFFWTTNGAGGTLRSATSSAATGFTDGSRHALKVTVDVNNGAAGVDVKFFTASTIDGTYSQLGSTQTSASTSSIFAGSGVPVEVGSTNQGFPGVSSGTISFNGSIYAFQLYSGIGGTLVANPYFTKLADGVSSFTDSFGNPWTLHETATIRRAWVDITSDTYARKQVDITRGRADEGQRADAARCMAEINNRTGNYSPRNPSGAYYGIIGRNTGMRVSIPSSSSYLALNDEVFDFVWTYDSAGLSITGDIDLRADIDLSSWDSLGAILIGKYNGTGNFSYAFTTYTDGTLVLFWSTDGTNVLTAQSTVQVPLPWHGRKAVRVTMDVNNGASGRTITFYTSDTISGSWTQLGATVVQSGTTSIFDSGVEVQVGGKDASYNATGHSKLYGIQILSGIAGTVKASPDFTSQTPGARTFTDAQSNVWSLAGNSEITDRDYRFWGEVSEFPQEWDVTGSDIFASITAQGIMRRLGQGKAGVASTMFKALSNQDSVVAYWPCEDGEAATSIASGIAGKPAMSFFSEASPDFANDSRFNCSQPLPTFSGARLIGQVPTYDNTNAEFQVRFLFGIPDGGIASNVVITNVGTTGSTTAWILTLKTSGALQLTAQAFDGTGLLDTGDISFGIAANDLLRINIGLAQNGTGIDYDLNVLTIGAGELGTSGTLASNTLGVCKTVNFNPLLSITDMSVGHISVQNVKDQLSDLEDETNAFRGEKAANRIRRLCQQEGVPVRVAGGFTDSQRMGYQLPMTLLDLLRECEDCDQGILTEPRDFLGIEYRTRSALYAQDILGSAALTLDYASAELSSIQPVDDDQKTANDVTLTRSAGGSSYQAVQNEGALSIANVGRYSDASSVNAEFDSDLKDLATWRMHVGTVDEARYPTIGVELGRSAFTENTLLTQAVRNLQIGDLLVIENPPTWLPPDDIRQIALGFHEVLAQFLHTFEINCAPASPYDVGIYDDTDSRYEVLASSLGAAATSGTTSLTVVTPFGPVWGTTDLPYDIYVGGERITVTAVSGSSSPQTLTVTRAVNGISKAHDPGTEVRLFKRVYRGL